MSVLISVIIPCYQQGQYLSDAVTSVLEQTYGNWECIIVNDGSSDNTEAVSNEWCTKDQRIKYLHKENGGLSSARNAGLREAKGSYVQFLDADDMIDRNKFLVQLKALETALPNTVAISDHVMIHDGSNQLNMPRYTSPVLSETGFKKEVITEWEFRRSIPCHNFLIPKKLIDEHRLSFYEKLSTHEDWVFWCQLLFFAPGVCYQMEKLAKYRIRDNSMTSDKTKMKVDFFEATFVLEDFFQAEKGTGICTICKTDQERDKK